MLSFSWKRDKKMSNKDSHPEKAHVQKRLAGYNAWGCRELDTTGATEQQSTGSVVLAPGLQSTGSIVVMRGLSCFNTCGIFLDQGSKPCLLHWQVD